MLLSYTELMAFASAGGVRPYRPGLINASSIDVTLGPKFRTETRRNAIVGAVLSGRAGLELEERMLSPGELYWLHPGEFMLASTAETIELPLNVSGEFRLKSSVGRMGLSHALAVWVDPGYRGQLTLELHNITQHHAVGVKAGDRIGQLIFHRHLPVPGPQSYAERGAYYNDEGPQGARPEKSS